MTFLDLVNNCLRRLREGEVASVSDTEYSTMVGDFVNDAKHIVENAYQWAALRQDLDVTTVASTTTYSLTGASSRSKIVDVWNETSDFGMSYKDKKWFRRREATAPSGKPQYFTYEGVDSSGNIKVRVFPTPDAAYTLEFNAVVPQARLSADSDSLLIPEMPVIHLALAMLARERGETGGTSAAELFQISDRYLKDAIAAEAARHEEELIYYTV